MSRFLILEQVSQTRGTNQDKILTWLATGELVGGAVSEGRGPKPAGRSGKRISNSSWRAASQTHVTPPTAKSDQWGRRSAGRSSVLQTEQYEILTFDFQGHATRGL